MPGGLQGTPSDIQPPCVLARSTAHPPALAGLLKGAPGALVCIEAVGSQSLRPEGCHQGLVVALEGHQVPGVEHPCDCVGLTCAWGTLNQGEGGDWRRRTRSRGGCRICEEAAQMCSCHLWKHDMLMESMPWMA